MTNPPGVLNKGRQPMSQIGGMSGVQVQLVGRAVEPELDSLVGRAPGQVILERYLYPLHRLPHERCPGS